MRSIKPITILLFACLHIINGNSQTALFHYLPSQPKVIFKINPASLGQKISWQEIVQYKMFDELMKDMPGEGRSFLNDPSKAGIDLSQGIFVTASQSKTDEQAETVVYCFPEDTLLFSNMMKQLTHAKKAVKTPKGNFVVDKNTVVAWNQQIIMITGVGSKMKGSMPMPSAKPVSAAEITKRLTDKAKSLLAGRAVPFTNEKLSAVLSQQGDMLFWIDNSLESAAKKNNKLPPAFGMLNKNLMRKGNYMTGIVNFETGEIVAKMTQYLSDSLASLYAKYPIQNINTELVKKLPAGQPIALCSFSFSPDMALEIYARAGFDKLIDSMTKHKVQINELLPAIKGDLMVGVIKAEEVAPGDSATMAMGGIQVFLAGSVNNKEKFQKIVDLINQPKQDPAKPSGPGKMKPVILSNGSTFVVSLSQFAAEKFLAASGDNVETEKWISPYKNSPAAVIIDLRTIFGFVLQSMSKGKSEEETRQASEVMGMFDKMICYGSQPANGLMETTMELTLTNKTENSLRQFLNMINLISSWKPKTSTALIR